MGRPLGSKNKPKDGVDVSVVSGDVVVTEDIKLKESEIVNHEEKREETAKAVQVKPVVAALGPGQKYFEAPTGEILIGEEDATHMWWRGGNGGKGMWINPKR